ncbi:hypothetical protein AB0L34_34265, partial [Micromonospora sp. NPDC052213]
MTGGSLVDAAQSSSDPGTTPPSGRRAAGLLRRLVAPERLYLGALGLTGLAAVMSVALPAAERPGDFNPIGVLWHHTAATSSATNPH